MEKRDEFSTGKTYKYRFVMENKNLPDDLGSLMVEESHIISTMEIHPLTSFITEGI